MTKDMRLTFSRSERLILIQGLRDLFNCVSASRQPTKWKRAQAIYEMAMRLASERTGRPETVWGFDREGYPERAKQFDEWIENLETRISEELARSVDPQK